MKQKYLYLSVAIAGIAAISVISFVFGTELYLSYLVQQDIETYKRSNPYSAENPGEVNALYVDSSDMKYICKFGEVWTLPNRNVGEREMLKDPEFVSGKLPPGYAKIINCKSGREVTIPVSYSDKISTERGYVERLIYVIPLNLEDGYHTVFMYNNDTHVVLPYTGIIRTKMNIEGATPWEEAHFLATGKPWDIHYTEAGVFGKVYVKEGERLVLAPEGTRVVLVSSDSPEAPIGALAVTNNGQFVLSEPVLSVNILKRQSMYEIYTSNFELKAVMPTGKESLYQFNVPRDDQDNMYLWPHGTDRAGGGGYRSTLLYYVDIIVES